MHYLDRISLALSKFSAYAAAAVMFGIVGFICIEIVLRNLFLTSTYMLDEIVGYGVAAMTFLGLGYAFERGAVIRVGIVVDRLRQTGPVRRAIEIVSIIATFAIVGVAVLGFARSVMRNYLRGVTSGTMADVPMWIPEGLVLFGLVVFLVQLLSYAIGIALGAPPQSDAETSGPGM